MRFDDWFRFKGEKTDRLASLAFRIFGVDFAFIISLTFEDCALLWVMLSPFEKSFFAQVLCFSGFMGRDSSIYD